MASGVLHHTMSSCAQTGQDGDILRVPRPIPLHILEADRDLLRGPKEGIFEVQAQVVSRRAECLLERLLEGAILLVHAANCHNDGAIVSYGGGAAAGDERAIRGDATGGTHLGGERRATTVRLSTDEEATGLAVRDGWRPVVGFALRKHIRPRCTYTEQETHCSGTGRTSWSLVLTTSCSLMLTTSARAVELATVWREEEEDALILEDPLERNKRGTARSRGTRRTRCGPEVVCSLTGLRGG
jgi:hypothetical protein